MHQPEVIYFNGDIHTLAADKQVVEAVAVENGKISAIGNDAEICQLHTEETSFVDLKGKTMIPGLIDAHLHIFPLGANLLNVDCRLSSVEEVVTAVKKQAAHTESEEEWIIGWGFDESQFKEGRKLTKWDFKDIPNPVYITRYCLHEAVANEYALELAGITTGTVITNGFIEHDEYGEVTGLLIENAMTLIEDILPPYTDNKMEKAIHLAQQYLLENGITAAHDAGLGFFEDPYREYDILRKLDESEELYIRMYLMVLGEYFKSFRETYGEKSPSDRIAFGAMKLFADGTLSGKNAALMEPYKDSTECGMLLYSDAEMERLVEMAHQMGEQVAIHAIGDRAVDQVLRIYERVQQGTQKNVRHRVEHAFITNETLLKKMAKLGAIPISQPALMYTAGDVHHEKIGQKDIKYMSLQSFKQYGLHPAGSSDGPVVEANPMLGIYAAMKRESIRGAVFDKTECMTLEDAIQMYTANAAYAAFQEQEKGTIEIGKLADFTVLPVGFMNFTADEVKETKVDMTIINGEICYQR